uniref:Integrase p58-like C-terminal domain-containing protein n=1 Tax=Aplanochytrium stocchinoi TaxID=215587 RepID=A0A7S3LI58_9STRA
MAHNMNYCRTGGDVPFYLLYGVDPVNEFELDVSALRHLGRSREDLKRLQAIFNDTLAFIETEFAKSMKHQKFGTSDPNHLYEVTELVWWNPHNVKIKSSKFIRNLGPYRVVEKLGSTTYKVRHIVTGRIAVVPAQRLLRLHVCEN